MCYTDKTYVREVLFALLFTNSNDQLIKTN